MKEAFILSISSSRSQSPWELICYNLQVQFYENYCNPVVCKKLIHFDLLLSLQADLEVSDFIRSYPAGGDIARFDK